MAAFSVGLLAGVATDRSTTRRGVLGPTEQQEQQSGLPAIGLVTTRSEGVRYPLVTKDDC